MGEFTINGAQNMAYVPIPEIKYRPTYYLADSQISVIQSEYGYCSFQEWKGRNFTVWLSEYPMQENATLYGAVSQRLIELQFMLGDGANHLMNGLGKIQVPASSMNLYHEPYVENSVFLTKGSKMITFDVHISPENLEAYCSLIPGLSHFVKKVEREQFASLLGRAIPVSPALLANIQAVLQTPSRPGIQHRILEPLIEGLLFSALCYLTDSRPSAIKADDRERKAIIELSDYLKTELDSDKTIEQLSKIYVFNTQKLKALFKESYGLSIHQYAIRSRMEKACSLLKDTDASIREIAFSVGYQTPSSFTERFREAYLLSPLAYRKSMQRGYRS